MTEYQKIIYKIAKSICKKDSEYYSDKNLISCYKSRMRESKEKKHTIEGLKNQYRYEQKWNRWFDKFEWNWDEEKGHAVWIDKITGQLAMDEDWEKI